MTQQGTNWFSGLKEHAAACRLATPIPVRDDLSDVEEWHCRIIGASLIHWLKAIGPSFLKDRLVVHKIKELDPDPCIVFTSNMPGLVAAREIIGEDSEWIVFLLGTEFDQWTQQHPDPTYHWHVHVWSSFYPDLQPDFRKLAQEKYPLSQDEVYWQHGEGTMWAELGGRGVDHLWKWDGTEPTLLEEALTHWIT